MQRHYVYTDNQIQNQKSILEAYCSSPCPQQNKTISFSHRIHNYFIFTCLHFSIPSKIHKVKTCPHTSPDHHYLQTGLLHGLLAGPQASNLARVNLLRCGSNYVGSQPQSFQGNVLAKVYQSQTSHCLCIPDLIFSSSSGPFQSIHAAPFLCDLCVWKLPQT